MDFMPDTLAMGSILALAGAMALLATLSERYKLGELGVNYFFGISMSLPIAGLDVPVRWAGFSETGLAVFVILLVTAFVRYARKELAEGEYD